MGMQRITISTLETNLADCLKQVKKVTTLVVVQAGQRVDRLVPDQERTGKRSTATVEWSGRRLKKKQPKARLRDGARLSDIVRENRGE